MRIAFEPSTLHVGKRGSVTGVVYFDFGAAGLFPSAGWSDFVVVVANWWLAAFDQISDSCKETELCFMDGPYWITVIAQQEGLLLRCTEDRPGAGVVHEAVVQLAELRHELTQFAGDVLRASERVGINSTDLDSLRTSVTKRRGKAS